MRIETGPLLAGALIVAGLGWGVANLVSAPPAMERSEPAGLQAGPVPDAARLQEIASRLRRPEPAAERPAAREPAPRPDLRLIGLVESDTGWVALFSVGADSVTARPGDLVGRYRLREVDGRSAVLEREGEQLRLELDS